MPTAISEFKIKVFIHPKQCQPTWQSWCACFMAVTLLQDKKGQDVDAWMTL